MVKSESKMSVLNRSGFWVIGVGFAILIALFLGGCGHHSRHHHKDSKAECTSCKGHEHKGSDAKCSSCKDKPHDGSKTKCVSCKDEHKGASHGEVHGNVESHATKTDVVSGKFASVPFRYRSKTYFAGAMNKEALTGAKDQGVTTVINLQGKNEIDFPEQETAEKMGLKYYSIPVSAKGSKYDVQTFAKIEEVYMKHHKAGEKVLVHCGSGDRVAAWFAYHLHITHKDTMDNAIAGAKDIGLNDDLEKKFRASF